MDKWDRVWQLVTCIALWNRGFGALSNVRRSFIYWNSDDGNRYLLFTRGNNNNDREVRWRLMVFDPIISTVDNSDKKVDINVNSLPLVKDQDLNGKSVETIPVKYGHGSNNVNVNGDYVNGNNNSSSLVKRGCGRPIKIINHINIIIKKLDMVRPKNRKESKHYNNIIKCDRGRSSKTDYASQNHNELVTTSETTNKNKNIDFSDKVEIPVKHSRGKPKEIDEENTNLVAENSKKYKLNSLFEEYSSTYLKTQSEENFLDAPQNYEKLIIASILEVERNTWCLLHELEALRLTEKEKTKITEDPFKTDKKRLDELFIIDDEFSEAWVVRQWLQSTAPSFNQVETFTEFFQDTLIENNTINDKSKSKSKNIEARNEEILKENDHIPDFKLVSLLGLFEFNGKLHPNDEVYNRELYKSIFEYLRRGEYETACDLCNKASQPWLAACISGFFLYDEKDSDFINFDEETFGNFNREIWRVACYKAAKEVNTHRDKYNRAIFSTLCGDAENVLLACNSWEDYLWAYYNELVESKLEQYFYGSIRQNKIIIDDFRISSKVLNLSPTDIFIKAFHEIQTYIILNDKDGVIRFVNQTLFNKYNLRNDDSLLYSHILQFAAHYVLYLFDLMDSVDNDAYEILKLYVDYLIEQKKDLLVPIYASKLPRQLSIEAYAKLLKSIIMEYYESRYKIFKLGNEYGLDMFEIAQKVFGTIYEEVKHVEWLDIWKKKIQNAKFDSYQTEDWNESIKENCENLERSFDELIILYYNPQDNDIDEYTLTTDKHEASTKEITSILDIYIPEVIIRMYDVFYKSREIIPEPSG
ncbi:12364_t:CDS:10 [Entrophospora sp. SA101]|nr:12364_t:CDS:10 [Entrophospora sp. SA101]